MSTGKNLAASLAGRINHMGGSEYTLNMCSRQEQNPSTNSSGTGSSLKHDLLAALLPTLRDIDTTLTGTSPCVA